MRLIYRKIATSIGICLSIQTRALFFRSVCRLKHNILHAIMASIVYVSTIYLIIFVLSPELAIAKSYIIYGAVCMRIFSLNLQNVAMDIITSRARNDILDILSSPCTGVNLLLSFCAIGVIRAYIISFVLLGLIFLFIIGEVTIYSIIGLCVFIAIGSSVFVVIGLLLSSMIAKYESFSSVESFVVGPLILFSGVFFSLKDLNHWLLIKICQFNPIFYIVSGVRGSITGDYDIRPLYSITFSLAFLLIMSFICVYAIDKYRQRLMPGYI